MNSSFNADEKLSLQSLQLIKLCERLHGETIGTIKSTQKVEANTQVSPNSSQNALPVFYATEEKKSSPKAVEEPPKISETPPQQSPPRYALFIAYIQFSSEESKAVVAPRKATIEKPQVIFIYSL